MCRQSGSVRNLAWLSILFLLLTAAGPAAAQWDAERRLTSNTGVIDLPCAGYARGVAMNGSTVHVVYHEQDNSMFTSYVYYTRSTNDGANWTARVQLSGGAFLPYAQWASIACNGLNIHAAWLELDGSGTAFIIRYRRSTNGGTSWLAAQTISTTGTTNELPSVAVSGSNVHIVWDDGGSYLYYRRSTDNGATWLTTINLSATAATGSVAADGSNVLVTYSYGSGSTWDIYMRRSTDGGATFAAARAFWTSGSLADISSVIIRGSNANLAWYDNGNGNYDVRTCRSTDAGATWRDTVLAATGSSSQEAPCIGVSSTNTLHLTYEDNASGNYEIIYKCSRNGGVTWTDSTRLTNASNTSQRPTIAVTGSDTVGVLYGDGRYNESNPDVFFRRGVIQAGTHDVGCTRILAPTGTIDSAQSVTPACSAYNYGTLAETYRVRMKVGSFYNDTARVTAHASGTRVYVTFPAYAQWPRGTHAVTCSTELAGDAQPTNDKQTGTATVRALDVEAYRIDVPSGTVDSGTILQPQAIVRNNGTTTVTFDVRFDIAGGYSNTQNVANLGPGSMDTILFASWTAQPRGTLATRCTTMLTGDMVPSNNLRTGTVLVRVLDAEALTIVAPTGTVDSGATLQPQATVRNNGNTAVTFNVRFDIQGGYSNTQTVTNLGAGSSTTVSFANWTAGQRGTLATKCTTMLTSDAVPGNNVRTGTVAVRIVDAQTAALVAPTGTVDSGTTLVPRAVVRNNGTGAATLNVRFDIAGGYSSIQTVTNLAPGSSDTVSFSSWTAAQRGSFATRCSAMLPYDIVEANNQLAGSVFVRVLDAEAVSISAPVGALDSGAVVQPQATVRNKGNTAATFDVRFDIAGGYSNTQTVTNLGAGSSTTVTFANWTAVGRGSQTTRCTTMLSGDLVPPNNRVMGNVLVNVHDVGAIAITSPAGAAPPGPLIPAVTVRNYGTTREPVRVVFAINSSPPYSDNVLLNSGLPFADTTVTFANWNAATGSYQASCSTWMATDQVHANDVVRQDFTVSSVDVGVVRIAAPLGIIPDTANAAPAAVVRNFGASAATFKTWFAIDSAGGAVFRDSATVAGLASGDSAQVLFRTWPLPHPAKSYSTRCSTWIAFDGNHANDVLTDAFRVTTRPTSAGWKEMTSLPAPPSGKAAKDGAWLVYDPSLSLVFGAKGNKTPDFYAYDPQGDSWKTLSLIPTGTEGKPPSKGAAGCADGNGAVYATKGNNTSGFYRYTAATDSWRQLANVPLGPSNKKVKGGTDLQYVVRGDTGFVYLLKGYRCEFFRYNTETDTWAMMTDAPTGTSTRWDKGSWLVYDGDRTLHAHKAKYHELWAYDVTLDAWNGTRLHGMPFVSRMGRSKKSKDGGCGAWLNDSLYALKGGNTQEFWQYRPQSDSWTELDTMPAFGSSLRKKKVKAGGDLTGGADALYAFKGNKSNEHWRYTPYPADGLRLAAVSRDGVSSSSSLDIHRSPFAISPNPLRSGFATLSFHLTPGSLDPVNPVLRIFDPSGRLVLHSPLVIRNSSFVLDLRGLSAGAFLVRLSADGVTGTQKLVVQR